LRDLDEPTLQQLRELEPEDLDDQAADEPAHDDRAHDDQAADEPATDDDQEPAGPAGGPPKEDQE
jgi:hypothetical protein